MTVPERSDEESGDSGHYAFEDPPPFESAPPEPTSFVKATHESGERPKKRRKKKKANGLLAEVAGEAEEVLARNRKLLKQILVSLAILAVVLAIVAAFALGRVSAAVDRSWAIVGGLLLVAVAAGYLFGRNGRSG